MGILRLQNAACSDRGCGQQGALFVRRHMGAQVHNRHLVLAVKGGRCLVREYNGGQSR